MDFHTDKQRAPGHGTAHEGTHHFWIQRVTAVALIPLAVLFVLPFAYNLGGDFDEVRAAYAHPINAIIAILFFGVMFRHLQLGLQVVIEDYIHKESVKVTSLLLVKGGALLLGACSAFAVLRLTFEG